LTFFELSVGAAYLTLKFYLLESALKLMLGSHRLMVEFKD